MDLKKLRKRPTALCCGVVALALELGSVLSVSLIDNIVQESMGELQTFQSFLGYRYELSVDGKVLQSQGPMYGINGATGASLTILGTICTFFGTLLLYISHGSLPNSCLRTRGSIVGVLLIALAIIFNASTMGITCEYLAMDGCSAVGASGHTRSQYGPGFYLLIFASLSRCLQIAAHFRLVDEGAAAQEYSAVATTEGDP